jgi:hypothetical protein
MTSAGLPDLARRSRIAFLAAVLLTLMVALIEVPVATPPHLQQFAAAA